MATKIKVRKRAKGNFMAIRTFRAHQTMLDKWDRHCDRVGVSRSELLRRFIAQLPTSKQKKPVVRVRVV